MARTPEFGQGGPTADRDHRQEFTEARREEPERPGRGTNTNEAQLDLPRRPVQQIVQRLWHALDEDQRDKFWEALTAQETLLLVELLPPPPEEVVAVVQAQGRALVNMWAAGDPQSGQAAESPSNLPGSSGGP